MPTEPRGAVDDAREPLASALRATALPNVRRALVTVLPDGSALSVEVQTPTTSDRFMALVTAVNPDAPPILQWDRPEGATYKIDRFD